MQPSTTCRWTLLSAYVLLNLALSGVVPGCGYLAAGTAGAVVGHEIAKEQEEAEEEDED